MSQTPRIPALATRQSVIEGLASLAAAAPSAVMPARPATPAPRAAAARARRLARLGGRTRLNLTPMIDVVFQLLVFFIATTRFVSGENVLRMDLPARTAAAPSAQAAEADPFAYVEDALRIQVSAGGGVSARAPVAAATTAADLRVLLAGARRDAANPTGALPPDFPIVIAPLPGATWEDAIGALNAAAGAGYRRVSFERAPGERAPGERAPGARAPGARAPGAGTQRERTPEARTSGASTP